MTGTNISSTDFIQELFDEYQISGLKYCLLRNYESLPSKLESRDVDILILSCERKKNREIINALVKKYRIAIYQHFVDERFDQFYLFRRNSNHDFFELKIDFFFDTELYGVCLVSGKEIIKSRTLYHNFYVASDCYKFLDKWLFSYLLGAQIPEKYHSEFRDICLKNRETLMIILSRLLGKRAGGKVVDRICAEGFADLPHVSKGTLFLILFRAAVRAPLFHAWHVPLFFYYRLKHTFCPKGEFICICGPDGSGKTTILEGAREQLEKLFGSRPENHGHFRPTVLPRIAHIAKRAGAISTVDEDYAEPHRGKPSGLMGSLARFSYYLLDYLWGYFTKIRPTLVRRELVIYDRYYFDMVADPGRSRISLPLWIRKLGLKILPLPNTAFFVHVSPEVVRVRKKELPLEKIKELNDAYLDMANASNLLVLENDATAETAIAKLVDTVIERRRKRFGLDQRYP